MRHAIEKILARYLEGRGWVVFWLVPEARVCASRGDNSGCWLALYESERKRHRRRP
jgi:hypothetical protein